MGTANKMGYNEFDIRILIQSQVKTTDPNSGEVTTFWMDLKPCWAEQIDSTTGNGEGLKKNVQIIATQKTIFKTRYFRGITPANHRIVLEDSIYNITEVQKVGRKKFLRIVTEFQDNTPGAAVDPQNVGDNLPDTVNPETGGVLDWSNHRTYDLTGSYNSINTAFNLSHNTSQYHSQSFKCWYNGVLLHNTNFDLNYNVFNCAGFVPDAGDNLTVEYFLK